MKKEFAPVTEVQASPADQSRQGQSKPVPSLQVTINGYQNNYTLIRFFLAAVVIYFHTFSVIPGKPQTEILDDWLQPIATLGGLAVQVFFFLSGLFVTQSYVKNPNVVHFAIKRFFRIWPGLFVCLVTTAIVACLLSSPSEIVNFFRFSEFYEYIVRNSMFDLTWDITGVFTGRTWTAINGSIHTLPLEVKMYLILAVFAVLHMLANVKRITLVAVLLCAITFIPHGHIALLDDFFVADYARGAVAMFFLGVLAFAWSDRIYVYLWQGTLLFALTALTKGIWHIAAFYLSVIWVTLYIGKSKWIGDLFRPRNDLSYGVYIYGWPCQQFVVSVAGGLTNPYLFAAISLLAATACAAGSWFVIEKPSIRLGHRLASVDLSKGLWIPSRLVPTSYESRLGGVLIAVLVVCVSMLWATRSLDLVPVVRMPVLVTNLGPKESKAGADINRQADGDSALWLTFDGHPEEGTAVVVDGHRLATLLGAGSATALVPPALLAHPGNRTIYLERHLLGQTQRSNTMTLHLSP